MSKKRKTNSTSKSTTQGVHIYVKDDQLHIDPRNLTMDELIGLVSVALENLLAAVEGKVGVDEGDFVPFDPVAALASLDELDSE